MSHTVAHCVYFVGPDRKLYVLVSSPYPTQTRPQLGRRITGVPLEMAFPLDTLTRTRAAKAE